MWENGCIMTKSVSNYQDAKAMKRNAVNDVKAVSHNILFYVRSLNKLAAKNEFCEKVNVNELAKTFKSLLPENIKANMKANEYFHASVFCKDYMNRVCKVSEYKGANVTVNQVINEGGAIFTDTNGQKVNGKEIRLNASGDGLVILSPITMTLHGVCAAFGDVVTANAKAIDEKIKAEKKAAKESAKAANKRAKEIARLSKQFANGEISGATFRTEIARLESEMAA